MHRSIWFATVLSIGLYTPSLAQITGKVTLDGTPPEMKEIKAIAAIPQCAQLHKDPVYEDTVIVGDKGELANVIVFIKETKPGDLKGPQKKTPARLDQKKCTFVPHVLAAEIGQPLLLLSSDPFLHNVRAETVANRPFNIPLFTLAQTELDPFIAQETFHIKCDVHPWMRAVVRVFDHPYFATTDEDGQFTIDTKGLKDGAYVVQGWHEVYGDSEPLTVDVKGGKAARELNFTYKAAGKSR